MRVLYLRTRYAFGLRAGGSVTHTSGVINAISQNNEIDVYSNDELPEVITKVQIIKPIALSILPTAVNEILYNCKVIRHLRKLNSYDIIYQRLSANSFCGAYLAKKHQVDFILEYNGSEAWGLKHWNKQYTWGTIRGVLMNIYKLCFETPIAGFIERYNITNAKKIVVVSHELKRLLERQNIDASKIIVSPNGVNISKFHPDVSGFRVRKDFGIDNSLVFGFIGSFGQWHGVEVLSEAITLFYKSASQSTNVKFLLIGDGLLMSQVKNTLSYHITSGNVILTGLVPQEESPYYLAACDVLLSPHISNPDGTKFFGSPTKLFEYMAMGKPIVASDLEQLGNVLENNKDSLLITPGDAMELASVIRHISGHWGVTDLQKLGQNARKKVVENYTWGIHVGRFL